MTKTERGSIQEWLRRLRENEVGAIELDAVHYGVTAGSVAAIAASMIIKYYNKNKVDALVMRRKDLPRHFGTFGIQKAVSKLKPPTLTKHVVERLRAYGIKTTHKSGYVVFERKKPKVNPQI